MKNIILKNSFWNILSYLYLLITAFIALPLTLRGLGPDNYARYLVLIAVSTVITSLDLGIPTALVRFLAGGRRDKSYLNNSLSLNLFGTFIVSAATFFIILSLNSIKTFQLNSSVISHLALATAVYTALNYLISLFAALPQSREDFAVSSIRAFIVGTGNTLLAAVVAQASGNLGYVIWVQSASAAFALLIFIIYALYYYGVSSLAFKWNQGKIKEILHFGLPVFVGNLAPQLQANLSKVITSGVLSTNALASLGVSQSLVFKGIGIYPQVASAIYPTAAIMSKEDRRGSLKKLALRSTIIFILATAAAYLIYRYLGFYFLSWWLGDSALASSVNEILLPYSLFVIALAATPAYSTIASAIGSPGIPALYAWIEVSLEIILILALLGHYGVLAVPYAALIAQVIVTPFFLLRVRKALS